MKNNQKKKRKKGKCNSIEWFEIDVISNKIYKTA